MTFLFEFKLLLTSCFCILLKATKRLQVSVEKLKIVYDCDLKALDQLAEETIKENKKYYVVCMLSKSIEYNIPRIAYPKKIFRVSRGIDTSWSNRQQVN